MSPSNQVMGLPENYMLKQTDFRSTRGGQRERWEHDVYDEYGRRVGSVSCWIETEFFGKPISEGWTRHDEQGQQVAVGNSWQAK